jgi:hypothetical protein
MRPMPDKNIYCGSYHCRGGHKWLPGKWCLDTINCGAHREYSAAEMQMLNMEKVTVTKLYKNKE